MTDRAEVMPFWYPDHPHQRIHGPTGYTNYRSYKPWLRDDFAFCCVYCLSRERWEGGQAAFGIDHALAQSTHPNLICDYDNLLYACNRCNSAKQAQVLLDPSAESMATHLRILPDLTVEGLTPPGLDLVDVLHLNDPERMQIRRRVLQVLLIFQAHPADPNVRLQHKLYLGYPHDLPDLVASSPPGNVRPDGIQRSYHLLRARGVLPDVYATGL